MRPAATRPTLSFAPLSSAPRAFRVTLSLAVVCFALGTPASAQKDAGTIVGTVTDPSGAVVPEAKVTVTDV